MSYEKWCNDGRTLLAQMPTPSEVVSRVDYLVNEVAKRAVIGLVGTLQEGAELSLFHIGPIDSELNFIVIDKDDLSKDNCGEKTAANLNAVAFVAHSGAGTILALPTHIDTSPLGNAFILTHELQHVTEKEEGLHTITPPSTHTAIAERRAWSLNGDIFRSFDDWRFDEYAIYLTYRNGGRNFSSYQVAADTSPTNPYRPPKGTFLDEAWQESYRARLAVMNASLFTNLEAHRWKDGERAVHAGILRSLNRS